MDEENEDDYAEEQDDRVYGLDSNMQTCYPSNPIRVDHSIFSKGPAPPAPKGPPKAPNPMRSGLKFSPIDGRKMWDSIEYLDDGTPLYTMGKESVLFFCIHGAGHSALSFTLLAQQLQEFATTVSYDIRGHGFSKKEGGEEDLSIDTLVDDAIKVFLEVVKRHPKSTFAILGHSLGGSIAVRAAKKLETMPEAERIIALISVDVVEGTAMEYLPYMVEIISQKPTIFETEESAIKWALQSKNVFNLDSARISIPPQLLEVKTDKGTAFKWKNELLKSEKFWPGWFKGLSSTFLSSKFPKICFIAARERLDKELEIANMQGKFRLVSFPNVGHCMMEDDPVATAKNCHMVLERFRCPLSTSDVEFIKEKGIPAFQSHLKPYTKN
jgi:protein phosphatase methylesterase 1